MNILQTPSQLNYIITNISMQAYTKAFFDSIQGLTPRGQMFRYFHLFDDKKNHQLALNKATHFYELAIKNNLLGLYNRISSLISIHCSRTSHKEPGDLQNLRREVESNYFREMNNLKKEIQDVKTNEGDKGLGALYYQIAKVGMKYGEYEEVEEHLRKIRDLKVMNDVDFYPMMLKSNILSRKIARSAAAILPNLQKSKMLNPEVIEFYVGQGLREVLEGKANFFSGLLNANPTPQQLAHNQFATPQTIGDFYSILIVANGKRKEVRSDVNFSSGFEQLYLAYKYSEYLQKANEILNKYQFDPFISSRIPEIRHTLKKVLLFEVLNAYKVVAIDKVIDILNYKEQDIKNLIALNRRTSSGETQYQIDPVEKTIILMEEGNPLLQFAQQINRSLAERQVYLLGEQLKRATSQLNKGGINITSFGDRKGHRGFGGGMGMSEMGMGMGGMGMGGMGMEMRGFR